MNKLLLALAALLLAGPALAQPQPAPKVSHPAWAERGNIYEVNVRQYTPEGTFNAFAQHLDRLQKMGVQTLWFMPINPISQKDRKGSLGSYYAVADYQKINPEFGTLADWQRLVAAIHARGMKVLIDWVPNHTGADHGWLRRHPDFYVKDKAGQPAVAFDWADVRQLDYRNRELQDSMTAAMQFWVAKTDVDGFRCDVAGNVPSRFWQQAIATLRRQKNLFMLAEGDSASLSRSGFDAVYAWPMMRVMRRVAQGHAPATSLDSMRRVQDERYRPGALQLYFTSNHDENTWNDADFKWFPGPVHAPFAVFTLTMPASIPLIYSGQEEPVRRAIKFFDRDPIGFKNYERAKFYRTLLDLRRRQPALAADAGFRPVRVGADERAVYAYVREAGGRKVLVILNLSAKAQTIAVADRALHGRPYNVFAGTAEPLSARPWQLEPWGYAVYEYGK